MIPILYEAAETEFATNGIGRLSDAVSCLVTQEGTGSGWPLELEMVYPVTGIHFADITEGRIILAVPEEDAAPQPFDIVQITRPADGKVTVYAQHISYRLSRIVTRGTAVPASPAACGAALQGLITAAILPAGFTFPFTFSTDVTAAASYTQDVPASIRSRLVGTEGSILDQFGGEYEWDRWNVILHQQRGTDNHVTIRYGKNLTDIEQDRNLQNTISGVVPYWKKDDVLVVGAIAYASNHGSFSQERIVPVDFTQQFDTQPTQAQLLSAGTIYANAHSRPEISIKVSFVALWQTEEYASVAPLEKVRLCDYVTVQFPELGIDERAKVVKTVYNVLLERYDSITIGDLKQTLTQVVTDGVQGQIDVLKTETLNATSWLTRADGYVVAVRDTDGTWKELIFSSEPDPWSRSANVLRINENGIGFSSTGADGPFTQAWTLDGNLSASFIHGGTLTLGGPNNVNGTMQVISSSGNGRLSILSTGMSFYEGANFINISLGTYPEIGIGNGSYACSLDAATLTISTGSFDKVVTSEIDSIGRLNISTSVTMKRGLTSDSDIYSTYIYGAALSGTTRALKVQSDGRFGYTSSSRRIKRDITEDLGEGMDPHGLYRIPVVQFRYKADGENGPLHLGFIAEDMAELFPCGVYLDDEGLPCGWDSDPVLAGAVRLIQEQRSEIDLLKQESEAWKREMRVLRNELSESRQEISILQQSLEAQKEEINTLMEMIRGKDQTEETAEIRKRLSALEARNI